MQEHYTWTKKGKKYGCPENDYIPIEIKKDRKSGLEDCKKLCEDNEECVAINHHEHYRGKYTCMMLKNDESCSQNAGRKASPAKWKRRKSTLHTLQRYPSRPMEPSKISQSSSPLYENGRNFSQSSPPWYENENEITFFQSDATKDYRRRSPAPVPVLAPYEPDMSRLCIVDGLGTAIPTSEAYDNCGIKSKLNGCSHGFEVKCAGTEAKCEIYINPEVCATHNWCSHNHPNNVAMRHRCTVELPASATRT